MSALVVSILYLITVVTFIADDRLARRALYYRSIKEYRIAGHYWKIAAWSSGLAAVVLAIGIVYLVMQLVRNA